MPQGRAARGGVRPVPGRASGVAVGPGAPGVAWGAAGPSASRAGAAPALPVTWTGAVAAVPAVWAGAVAAAAAEAPVGAGRGARRG